MSLSTWGRPGLYDSSVRVSDNHSTPTGDGVPARNKSSALPPLGSAVLGRIILRFLEVNPLPLNIDGGFKMSWTDLNEL